MNSGAHRAFDLDRVQSRNHERSLPSRIAGALPVFRSARKTLSGIPGSNNGFAVARLCRRPNSGTRRYFTNVCRFTSARIQYCSLMLALVSAFNALHRLHNRFVAFSFIKRDIRNRERLAAWYPTLVKHTRMQYAFHAGHRKTLPYTCTSERLI